MKSKVKKISVIAVVLLFILCILDSKNVIDGAKTGIDICINTVVPSLFPFIFLSKIVCDLFEQEDFTLIRKIGNRIGMPRGCEHLLILGLLGGYPVGAQAIYDAYHTGRISKGSAEYLLGFCNNAGPAFIFGMLASAFTGRFVPWVIWLIHISSAILVSIMMPNKYDAPAVRQRGLKIEITTLLNKSIKSIAMICGWIIVFRIIISCLQNRVLEFAPPILKLIVIGVLELSNGCIELTSIPDETVRFIIACGFLAFGGICVGFQTSSVVKELGIKQYCRGKILQTILSILLACLASKPLFSGEYIVATYVLLISILILILIFITNSVLNIKKQ